MAVEVRVPTLGESIVEATVGKWLKRVGDAVAAGETLVDLETDKVSVEVTAGKAGVLEQIIKGEGERGRRRVIGTLGAGAARQNGVSAPAAAACRSANACRAAADERDARATPVARRILAEEALICGRSPAAGRSGRVTKEDIATQQAQRPPRLLQPQPSRAATRTASGRTGAPAPAADSRGEERVRLTRRRQTIAQPPGRAQHNAAMLTTFNEIDMTAVMELRKRRKDTFKERHGIGLGFMSFFTRAVVGALKAFPMLNAELQGSEIVLKRYYDIGIAVGVEEGLVVPVLRDADRKSFAQIEREIADLAGRARDGKLTLAELQGGTFTITNGGVFGSLMSTPILNAPQVGILGMHKIEERPIALNGQVVIRPMMYVALSYDHRLIDGSTSVRFLVRVKELVEDPEALLLEG
ncbi:2-oxoglutarate dehydrogenase complex dihydrolipoyllysine-residue succinyltransferase [Kouleothrix sp.]|uniref:2-oxoglutarate dehydrogenase complex dihydrolipoyllysine-residue succinyltransferase n=1 Tax=Kouleothrix sp. TaxID=2779161 RepID=UPI00391A649C